jgi:hypothetical protein
MTTRPVASITFSATSALRSTFVKLTGQEETDLKKVTLVIFTALGPNQ